MDENLETKFIKLNVGGKLYTTTKSTLCKYKDSFLEKLCQENEKSLFSEKDENGAFMIDRDGELFKYILNFLRDNQLRLTENVSLESIKVEADFYLLPDLVHYCDNKIELKKEFEPVLLNVGGFSFKTTVKVLCKSQYFKNLFDQDEDLINIKDENGIIFIDRNGQLFEHVLNFLKFQKFYSTEKISFENLLIEAQFYLIPELINHCKNIIEFKKEFFLIKFYVGDEIFESTEKVLSKSPFFKRIFDLGEDAIEAIKIKDNKIVRGSSYFDGVLHYLKTEILMNRLFDSDYSKGLKRELSFYGIHLE